MHRNAPRLTCLVAICLTWCCVSSAWGQLGRARRGAAKQQKNNAPETQLEMEIITGTGGVNLDAQRWASALKKLDVVVRIRRGTSKDQPGVTEKNFGTAVRRVSIIAALDRNGRISLPGKAFTLKDNEKLVEWLRNLRTYGAQGSPDGQPAWGLTKAQLDQVLTQLRRPMTIDPEGKNLLDALLLFAPDREKGDLPIHVTPEAKQIMGLPEARELFPQSLLGISRGTALAIILKHYGLCYTPSRTPSGDLELTLRDPATTTNPWKIGWPFPKNVTRDKIAPNLFKQVNVELVDLPLIEVVEAAAGSIEIPILLDHRAMEDWEIDAEKTRVNFPRKRTTWGIAIKRIAFQSRLQRQLYVDEAGKPFVWLTPIEFKSRSAKPKTSVRRK